MIVSVERFAPLLTSDTGHFVQMISSHGALVTHEQAYDLWYSPMSLWYGATSHFHKNIPATALMAGNDAESADECAAMFLSDVKEMCGHNK